MPDIVKLLIAERDRIDRAIAILEGTVRQVPERIRKPMSAAARKRQSESMKKYWAARRKAAKKS